MRIHLGHHFYGAGNLGDDFLLAGFLAVMETLAPGTQFTASVPFALEPLRRRFPQIEWQPYDRAVRATCIADADLWLGVGGSPFQSALSRWFVDHLLADADMCRQQRTPMAYLGVGVQGADELAAPEIQALCGQAEFIGARDPHSAERLAATVPGTPVVAGADLAHLFFAQHRPPTATLGRLTLVANFDYHGWPGLTDCLAATADLAPRERVWLAQESRELPGAEKALFAELPPDAQSQWRLIVPDLPGAPLPDALSRWPSGEWLVTARFHAALAGAWSGSKPVVIATNEKLRAVARELACPSLAPNASRAAVAAALAGAAPTPPPVVQAQAARDACVALLARIGRR